MRINQNSQSLIHFIVIDNTENRAIIEFINGKMVVYTQKEMQYLVLTNNIYLESLVFSKEHRFFIGKSMPSTKNF